LKDMRSNFDISDSSKGNTCMYRMMPFLLPQIRITLSSTHRISPHFTIYILPHVSFRFNFLFSTIFHMSYKQCIRYFFKKKIICIILPESDSSESTLESKYFVLVQRFAILSQSSLIFYCTSIPNLLTFTIIVFALLCPRSLHPHHFPSL
jgi:hypothetical protein